MNQRPWQKAAALRFNDQQFVAMRGRAALLDSAELVDLIIKLVVIGDGVDVRWHRDDTFPAVVHVFDCSHGITFGAHDDIRLNRVPLQRLLARIQRNFDGIKIVFITDLPQGRDVCDGAGATRQQNHQWQ